ncbi:hypothetical protein ABC955_01010 [Citromicrobium bathyomarinum]|jgi:hypothetical protein|nr:MULTISPECIES: hypothetical protein [Sphingomonadales]|tara:strand:+ start:1612 stop:1734 length:123 start_codon:yes stop_codon:yes gene_type:complete
MKAVAAIRTADETVLFAQGLALLLVIFLVLLIQRGGVPIG